MSKSAFTPALVIFYSGLRALSTGAYYVCPALQAAEGSALGVNWVLAASTDCWLGQIVAGAAKISVESLDHV